MPRRRGGERGFGRMSQFRRLARDYDRSPEILAGLRYLAFIVLMLKSVAGPRSKLITGSKTSNW